MRFDSVPKAVVDGPQVEVVGFDDAEVAFDVGELLVAVHHGGGVEGVGVDAGAQHVDAIQGGLGVDGGLVAVVFEPGVGDREVEVLAHLELSADLADCDADLVGAGQGSLADALGDVGQFLLGRLQEVLAFAGAFGGQRRVAAGDQPFAGVVGVGDLGKSGHDFGLA